MRSILTLCLFAGSALCVNNSDAVNSVCQSINSYLNLLDSDVKNFDSTVTGVAWALQVQVDAVLIDNQIANATALAQSSDNFGEPGSASLSATLILLSNTVSSVLKDVSNKKATFDELSPIVLASLYQLRADTKTLSDSIVAKLDPLLGVFSPVVTSGIDSAFSNAITTYGGTGKSALTDQHLNVTRSFANL